MAPCLQVLWGYKMGFKTIIMKRILHYDCDTDYRVLRGSHLEQVVQGWVDLPIAGIQNGPHNILVQRRKHLLQLSDIFITNPRRTNDGPLRRFWTTALGDWLLRIGLHCGLLRLIIEHLSGAGNNRHRLTPVGRDLVRSLLGGGGEGEDEVYVSLLAFALAPTERYPLLHCFTAKEIFWKFVVGPGDAIVDLEIALVEYLNVEAAYTPREIAREGFVPAGVLWSVRVRGRLVNGVTDADATVGVHPCESVIPSQLCLGDCDLELSEVVARRPVHGLGSVREGHEVFSRTWDVHAKKILRKLAEKTPLSSTGRDSLFGLLPHQGSPGRRRRHHRLSHFVSKALRQAPVINVPLQYVRIYEHHVTGCFR